MVSIARKLVKLKDHGLDGQNYHVINRARFNISKHELKDIGIHDADCYVSEDLIKPLQEANTTLLKQGYKLYITDGYRSKELYKLAHSKRKKTEGKMETQKIMNMSKMPHSSGLTVDVTLRSVANGRLLLMRRSKDGVEAKFIDFYKNKKDLQSKELQNRQLILRRAMENAGFKLGKKQEFWHFELVKIG